MVLRFIAMLGTLLLCLTAAKAEPILEEEIPGQAVVSGEADDRLEAIGRRAAGSGLVLQVNAPDLWEAEILTPLRRGAGDKPLEVKFVNTMRDSAVIRGVEASEAEDPLETLKRITNDAKARSLATGEETAADPGPGADREPRDSKASRPDIERPAMDVPEVRVERPRADLPRADARASSRRALEEQGAAPQAPDAAEPTDPGVGATPSAEAGTGRRASAPGEKEAAAAEADRFEQLYNNGRTIHRNLPPKGLKAGDLVFKGTHHNVVVRRGISTEAYWLAGKPPEGRLEHEERNRYVVTDGAPGGTEPAVGRERLPGEAAERQRFERLYNRGREIRETVGPGGLEAGDELYVGDSITVVLRRSRLSIDAFWLAEPVELDQPGIEHDERNKYLVVGEVE